MHWKVASYSIAKGSPSCETDRPVNKAICKALKTTLTLYCGNPRLSTQSATSSELHWEQGGNTTDDADVLSAILWIATATDFGHSTVSYVVTAKQSP